ncbi:hypothetical protein TRIUR3_30582 [Triticum urartu]|uniref:Uncharacterized protein n=1 Tax=Triticum urartu TaxID=4572 RepID=M7ZK68_TRIUA|nr:hypothetical protein TRIUR3_30582 [Triticum urartu]
MSSLGTSKGILEIAKFGVYVAVPVTLTYLVATDSKAIKKLMGLGEPGRFARMTQAMRETCKRGPCAWGSCIARVDFFP